MDKTYKIEISPRTIVFTIVFILVLQLLWVVKELIFSLLVAFILMSALNPWVTALNKKRIPRGLSAAIIFITLLLSLGGFLFWIIPPIVYETTLLFQNLPSLVKNINPNLSQYMALDYLGKYIPSLTGNAFVFLRTAISNIILVISVLFFSLYLLIEENAIKQFILRFVSKKNAVRVITTINKIEKRMRSWFWGEAILMLSISVITFIGLSLIGVRYALPLAIIAGLLEIVPFLGPILSLIPAFIVASAESYFLGLATVALYFVIHQSENQIIVPLVMKKAVGLNPIATLVALIIGGKLLGFLGILLAIPITLLIEVMVTEFFFQR